MEWETSPNSIYSQQYDFQLRKRQTTSYFHRRSRSTQNQTLIYQFFCRSQYEVVFGQIRKTKRQGVKPPLASSSQRRQIVLSRIHRGRTLVLVSRNMTLQPWILRVTQLWSLYMVLMIDRTPKETLS